MCGNLDTGYDVIDSILPRSFYHQNTVNVARKLLGTLLIKKADKQKFYIGRIVETEAYLHGIDMASHSYSGITKRNKAMFEQGGILYVYKSYGIHHCINVVTGMEGVGSAVLLRALEPIEGIELMESNRGSTNKSILCKGPGNLAKAFGLTIEDNYHSLNGDSLFLASDPGYEFEIVKAKRIGITKSMDWKLRFYIKNSKWISRK